MAEYTKIETAMAIICDRCEDLYLDDFCPEKRNLGKCGWRRYLEKDAANVAPVVRCKDCKNRYSDSWCEYVDDDNFYCARGERKECADNGKC